jgi:hypothetical protein
MRSLTVCLLLLASACSANAEAPRAGWTRYTFQGGRTAIQFPGKAQDKPLDSGRQLSLDALGGKAGYVVLATDFPVTVKLDAATARRLLDQTATAVAQFKGKVVSQRDLRLGKFYGRAVDVKAEGFDLYRTQIFVTPKRLYQVIVVGPRDFVNGSTARKFFQSFKPDE